MKWGELGQACFTQWWGIKFLMNTFLPRKPTRLNLCYVSELRRIFAFLQSVMYCQQGFQVSHMYLIKAAIKSYKELGWRNHVMLPTEQMNWKYQQPCAKTGKPAQACLSANFVVQLCCWERIVIVLSDSFLCTTSVNTWWLFLISAANAKQIFTHNFWIKAYSLFLTVWKIKKIHALLFVFSEHCQC